MKNQFTDEWHKRSLQYLEDTTKWVADMRAQGVKAAHPDDGWVDRKANTVQFAYSTFDDGVQVADLIALGHHNKYRIVRVTEITRSLFGPLVYYFKPYDG